MLVQRDDWLSGVLGYDAFRVSRAAPTAPTASDSLSRPGFYFAKVRTTDVGSMQYLCHHAFNVVDVNVTFESTPRSLTASQHEPQVVDLAPSHHQPLRLIARHGFAYSRFHLDPEFAPTTADHIKGQWIESYLCGQRGERLYVAEIGGRAVGFLATLAASVGEETCGVIDLIATAADYRGRGVARSLIARFMTDAVGNYERLRVGTQVANIPSIRLYEGCGFRLAASAFVLHKHVQQARGNVA